MSKSQCTLAAPVIVCLFVYGCTMHGRRRCKMLRGGGRSRDLAQIPLLHLVSKEILGGGRGVQLS